jgi:hypothetical protein
MKKINTNLLFSLLAIIFFFFSFKSYAQEESGTISIPDAQKSTIETVNTANEVDANEYNSARSQAVNATTAVSNAIIFLDPTIVAGWEDIYGSDSITNDMKRGIYGMAQDGVYAMYTAQPYVNVYAHLANEWVPGYEDSMSVYAKTELADYDSGYKELTNSGIVNLWSLVRNITYVFFMLIFIVIGFMIMFRSKIGGQTLVTLGNTLPNIILALIGVTFSFAIAGLLIDIGGVLMAILVDIFDQTSNYEHVIRLGSFASIWSTFGRFGSLETLADSVVDVMTRNTGFAGWVGRILFILNPAGTIGLVGIVGLIFLLVALGLVTVGTFKVFISLIKAYLGILVNVITGPFQIAISAIPGKSHNFMNWIKNIFRNVLVYPITFAILNFPGILYSLQGEMGLSLPGPDKLTIPSATGQINQSRDYISIVLVFILQILVLFAASNADKYAQAIIPPTTTKEGAVAADAVKKGMQGIPFIGKLIK